MERQRYREILAVLRLAQLGHRDNPRNTHRDVVIVQVLIWAMLHGRSVDWATKRQHWPGDLRPRGGLPSQSCMSRRQQTLGVLELIQRLEDRMRQALPRGPIKLIDARPLAVGGCSKDPDARRGYAAGQWMRGYKLHLLCDTSGAVDCWHLTDMPTAETAAAQLLIDHCPAASHALGDGGYDINPLYDHADRRGIQWVALPRKKNAKAPGHHTHHPRRMAVWHWVRSAVGSRQVRRARLAIERFNAWQGQAQIGLTHLPHHVRRIHRVRLWVALKLVVYHHWLASKQVSDA